MGIIKVCCKNHRSIDANRYRGSTHINSSENIIKHNRFPKDLLPSTLIDKQAMTTINNFFVYNERNFAIVIHSARKTKSQAA